MGYDFMIDGCSGLYLTGHKSDGNNKTIKDFSGLLLLLGRKPKSYCERSIYDMIGSQSLRIMILFSFISGNPLKC